MAQYKTVVLKGPLGLMSNIQLTNVGMLRTEDDTKREWVRKQNSVRLTFGRNINKQVDCYDKNVIDHIELIAKSSNGEQRVVTSFDKICAKGKSHQFDVPLKEQYAIKQQTFDHIGKGDGYVHQYDVYDIIVPKCVVHMYCNNVIINSSVVETGIDGQAFMLNVPQVDGYDINKSVVTFIPVITETQYHILDVYKQR